jgi:hypothetical protein
LRSHVAATGLRIIVWSGPVAPDALACHQDFAKSAPCAKRSSGIAKVATAANDSKVPYPVLSMMIGGCTGSNGQLFPVLMQRRIATWLSDLATLQRSLPCPKPSSGIDHAATAAKAHFVRIGDIERAKMLRNCSNDRFGEAAARRRMVGSMSGLDRTPNFAAAHQRIELGYGLIPRNRRERAAQPRTHRNP